LPSTEGEDSAVRGSIAGGPRPLAGAADSNALKQAAAVRAVAEVESGMVLGLGSGTTAALALEALAARISEGLRVVGIPTSEKTAMLARRHGVPLTTFDTHRRIDLTIDGADEVDRRTFHLIKGLGGALLREKIIAAASERMIVVVDESKVVDCLGAHGTLPVEIVSFGWQTTLDRLAAMGCQPRLRMVADEPFMTDGGNYIVDCIATEIADPAALEAQLADTVGVVESGLFISLASMIVIGRKNGVEVLNK
jgi:ribose 5-phosphate isomerase A